MYPLRFPNQTRAVSLRPPTYDGPSDLARKRASTNLPSIPRGMVSLNPLVLRLREVRSIAPQGLLPGQEHYRLLGPLFYNIRYSWPGRYLIMEKSVDEVGLGLAPSRLWLDCCRHRLNVWTSGAKVMRTSPAAPKPFAGCLNRRWAKANDRCAENNIGSFEAEYSRKTPVTLTNKGRD